MDDDELLTFQQRWKKELEKKTQAESTGSHNSGVLGAQCTVTLSKTTYFKDSCKSPFPLEDETGNCSNLSGNDSASSSYQAREVKDTSPCKSLEERAEHQPQYVSIAEGLLDGRSSPLLDRIQEERTRRKRQHGHANFHSNQQPQKKVNTGKKLVDQFIQDLVRCTLFVMLIMLVVMTRR